jgi:hypothetical protein
MKSKTLSCITAMTLFAARAAAAQELTSLRQYIVLFKTDGLAIATLCSNLALFWQADRAVQEVGDVIRLEHSYDVWPDGVAMLSHDCGRLVRSGSKQ